MLIYSKNCVKHNAKEVNKKKSQNTFKNISLIQCHKKGNVNFYLERIPMKLRTDDAWNKDRMFPRLLRNSAVSVILPTLYTCKILTGQSLRQI